MQCKQSTNSIQGYASINKIKCKSQWIEVNNKETEKGYIAKKMLAISRKNTRQAAKERLA